MLALITRLNTKMIKYLLYSENIEVRDLWKDFLIPETSKTGHFAGPTRVRILEVTLSLCSILWKEERLWYYLVRRLCSILFSHREIYLISVIWTLQSDGNVPIWHCKSKTSRVYYVQINVPLGLSQYLLYNHGALVMQSFRGNQQNTVNKGKGYCKSTVTMATVKNNLQVLFFRWLNL